MLRTLKDYCLAHRGLLLALLTVPIAFGAARMGMRPRPRASWQEFAGRVVRFSPQGETFVTAGAQGMGGTFRETGSGRVRAVLASEKLRQFLMGVTFTPDGRHLIGEVGEDYASTLKVWEVASGRVLASFPSTGPSETSPNFAVSEDWRTLAFRSAPAGQFPTGIKLWDIPGRTLRAEVSGQPPWTLSVDGRRLAAAVDYPGNKEFAAWEDRPGGWVKIRTFQAEQPPRWLGFSPGGRSLAMQNGAESVILPLSDDRKSAEEGPFPYPWPPWAAAGDRPPAVLNRLGGARFPWERLDRPAFSDSRFLGQPNSLSGDGKTVAMIDNSWAMRNRWNFGPRSRDRDVILQDLPSRRERAKFRVGDASDIALAPDGRWFALLVHDQISPDVVTKFLRSLYDARRAGDPRYEAEIQVFDATDGREIASAPLPEGMSEVGKLIASPDGRTLAFDYALRPSDGSDPSGRMLPHTIELWDIPPRRPIWLAWAAGFWCVSVIPLGIRADRRRRPRSRLE